MNSDSNFGLIGSYDSETRAMWMAYIEGHCSTETMHGRLARSNVKGDFDYSGKTKISTLPESYNLLTFEQSFSWGFATKEY